MFTRAFSSLPISIRLSVALGALTAGIGMANARDQDWAFYGGDAGGTRHSSATQITPANVATLEPVWTYRTGETERHPKLAARSAFQATPILAAGSLIFCTPFSRIVALDPESGAERWTFDPHVAEDLKVPVYKCRGVAAWTDPRVAPDSACKTRVLVAVPDGRILAIDARTGSRCARFARNGELAVALEETLAEKGEVTVPHCR